MSRKLILQSLTTIFAHRSNFVTASRLTRVIAALLAANRLGLLTVLTVAPIADLAAILTFLHNTPQYYVIGWNPLTLCTEVSSLVTRQSEVLKSRASKSVQSAM